MSPPAVHGQQQPARHPRRSLPQPGVGGAHRQRHVPAQTDGGQPPLPHEKAGAQARIPHAEPLVGVVLQLTPALQGQGQHHVGGQALVHVVAHRQIQRLALMNDHPLLATLLKKQQRIALVLPQETKTQSAWVGGRMVYTWQPLGRETRLQHLDIQRVGIGPGAPRPQQGEEERQKMETTARHEPRTELAVGGRRGTDSGESPEGRP